MRSGPTLRGGRGAMCAAARAAYYLWLLLRVRLRTLQPKLTCSHALCLHSRAISHSRSRHSHRRLAPRSRRPGPWPCRCAAGSRAGQGGRRGRRGRRGRGVCVAGGVCGRRVGSVRGEGEGHGWLEQAHMWREPGSPGGVWAWACIASCRTWRGGLSPLSCLARTERWRARRLYRSVGGGW